MIRRSPIKRRSRPRRRRKGTRAALGREADRLCGIIVRSKGGCEICAGTDRLQWAHGFSRRYKATRWLPINGFCLCAGCHYKYTLRPLEFDQFLRDAWGPDVYDELRDLALSSQVPDLVEVVAGLKAEADKLQLDY